MTDYGKILDEPRYAFLQEDPHLKGRMALLALGGSHAYGTAVEGSDIDLRGCFLPTKEEILTGQLTEPFSQYEGKDTDTVIYSFPKLVKLLCDMNPNVCEILGCRQEHYLITSPIGRELLDNTGLFLSKRCIRSFGGYAIAQMRRLENLSARHADQARREDHILETIRNVWPDIKERHALSDDDMIKLYIGTSEREGMDREIFMDTKLSHYPLRDYALLWNELKSIASSYEKAGKRNLHAREHGKLTKHMMHLVRLYLMCTDILEQGKIVTYREAEHDLLMDIRNGKYVDDEGQPTQEFRSLTDRCQARMKEAAEKTELPDAPDMYRIKAFTMSVNERIVRGIV